MGPELSRENHACCYFGCQVKPESELLESILPNLTRIIFLTHSNELSGNGFRSKVGLKLYCAKSWFFHFLKIKRTRNFRGSIDIRRCDACAYTHIASTHAHPAARKIRSLSSEFTVLVSATLEFSESEPAQLVELRGESMTI